MTRTKEYEFGWVFMIVAILVLIFGFELVWWHAILVVLLASLNFKITTTSRYRRL